MPKKYKCPGFLKTQMGYKKLDVNAWKKIIYDVIETDLIGDAFKSAVIPVKIKNEKFINHLLAYIIVLDHVNLYPKEQHVYLKNLTKATNELIKDYAESEEKEVKSIITNLLPLLQDQANTILRIPEEYLNLKPSFYDCLSTFFKCHEIPVDDELFVNKKEKKHSSIEMKSEIVVNRKR